MSKRRSIKFAGNNEAKVAKVEKRGKEDDDETALFVKLKDQRNFNRHRILDQSVPLKMNELRGKLDLGDSLTRHAAKFHKSCKLKFGNEKLDKAMNKFEKQEKSGEPSTSQARGNY